jgi:hypothetical protein
MSCYSYATPSVNGGAMRGTHSLLGASDCMMRPQIPADQLCSLEVANRVHQSFTSCNSRWKGKAVGIVKRSS